MKVVEKPRGQEKPKTGVNVGILDVAKFLENSTIPEEDLVDARHTMLRTRRKANGGVCLALLDSHGNKLPIDLDLLTLTSRFQRTPTAC